MPLIGRNDEQIKVGLTTGLVADATSFTFDGTGGKPDYRGYEIILSEISGRGILVKGLDYSWDYTTGEFNLLQLGDNFQINQWYNIHFQNIAQAIIGTRDAIINYTFFIRDINITNIEPSPTAKNAPSLERLNSFIAKHEPECLRLILGYPLYKVFLTEASQRMTDLLFGVEYTVNSVLRKWDGLVYEPKISLIANYVYYHYQEANAAQSTGTGTKVVKPEAGTAVSPAEKMMAAWNFFSSEVNRLHLFLWNNKTVYPEISYNYICYAKGLTRPISYI